jgi:hypothetical protein
MQEFKNFEELEQAYKALKQEVALLEQEWRQSGVVQEINAIETEFLEEQTANEVNKPELRTAASHRHFISFSGTVAREK